MEAQRLRFEDFFETCAGHRPYDFQRAFATAPRLPDLLEAPTGSGKTATAVLGWLFRRLHGSTDQRQEAGRRLVFCLPMRTLVEQTEANVRRWRERLGLSQSDLGIHVLMGGAVDDAWEEFPERNAILIGTQDQLLSRALMRGYAMSRYKWPMHFALVNNDCTWIMDEVQLMGVGASTAAQLQAFREAFGTSGTVRTVWMTATLDEGKLRTVDVRRELTRQSFDTTAPALLARLTAAKILSKARTTSGKKGTLGALATEIGKAHVPGTLTLVIVNRVARAQELRSLLSNLPTVERTALVHSRFRPRDRARIQAAALSGAFHGVLIATQAIEAGVDISARTLFTELAPWPSLVQRFGRLNRAAEHATSAAFWVDLDTTDADACLPYEATTLDIARTRLQTLSDVGPRSLAAVPREIEEPAVPVIRRKDLLELFDTEPDLAGHDIDVTRYIRIADERDIQVAWRDLGTNPPTANAPDIHRDELCAVPAYELSALAKGRAVWRFDSLRREWVSVDSTRLFPGLTVVVDRSVGGYDDELGFTRDKADRPSLVELGGPTPEADEADELTYWAREYVSLATHADDTAAAMADLLATVSGATRNHLSDEELVEAARWHDAGKSHHAFQEMLLAGLNGDDPRRESGPWAKSDGRSRYPNRRRYFRHELGSALAWMAAGKSDLGAYLVASHHGKVRMTIRARPGEEGPPSGERFAHGIYDGDVLPASDLGSGAEMLDTVVSLALMELGGETRPWVDRTQSLLRKHGPFSLAYLEALVRVADWRASRKRATDDRPQGTVP